MVFSSINPAYHDPSNWQQQPTNHSQFLPPPPLPPPPPPPQPHGSGSIRPGSMADRARMANIPMPETAQKCPRCESTNTKFCYFNNYSLTQPRHFCKTCRRYWTRGGALRNVPVGGGCRRNKRSSKGSSSKSPVSSDRQTGSTSSATPSSAGSLPSNNNTNPAPDIRLMPPFHHHHLTDFADQMGLNYGLTNYGGSSNVGVGVGVGDFNFQLGRIPTAASSSSLLSAHGMDQYQWRLQQFPFMAAGLDPPPPPPPPPPHQLPPAGLFESGGAGGGVEALGYHHLIRPKPSTNNSGVKMEDHHHHHHHHHNHNTTEMNLSRQLLGMSTSDHNQYYWSSGGGGGDGTSNIPTTAWTDLSGFTSSSPTSNPPSN